MNWRNATFAGLTHRLSYAVRGFFHRFQRRSGGGSDTAPITRQTQTPSLPPQLALETVIHKRAIRVCNREPKAIAKYMQAHLNLSRDH